MTGNQLRSRMFAFLEPEIAELADWTTLILSHRETVDPKAVGQISHQDKFAMAYLALTGQVRGLDPVQAHANPDLVEAYLEFNREAVGIVQRYELLTVAVAALGIEGRFCVVCFWKRHASRSDLCCREVNFSSEALLHYMPLYTWCDTDGALDRDEKLVGVGPHTCYSMGQETCSSADESRMLAVEKELLNERSSDLVHSVQSEEDLEPVTPDDESLVVIMRTARVISNHNYALFCRANGKEETESERMTWFQAHLELKFNPDIVKRMRELWLVLLEADFPWMEREKRANIRGHSRNYGCPNCK